MIPLLLGALSWNPHIKGALYVVIAIVTLVGSAYLLLMTNVGARLSFQLTVAGFFGWMTVMGAIWWAYGQGPTGESPTWKIDRTVVGDLADSGSASLRNLPRGWEVLEVTDPEVADAQPVAEGALVGRGAPFSEASDYLVVGAFEKGGERYGPLGLNIRPFNVFHEPRYLVLQAQRVAEVQPVPGQPPPKATADSGAPVVSVMLIRDLGSLRLRPALVCIFSGLIFGLTCYLLHVRDKEAAARRG